jgi:hypothetical protein
MASTTPSAGFPVGAGSGTPPGNVGFLGAQGLTPDQLLMLQRYAQMAQQQGSMGAQLPSGGPPGMPPAGAPQMPPQGGPRPMPAPQMAIPGYADVPQGQMQAQAAGSPAGQAGLQPSMAARAMGQPFGQGMMNPVMMNPQQNAPLMNLLQRSLGQQRSPFAPGMGGPNMGVGGWPF